MENEIANQNAWLTGLYIYNAISANLYNCFGRKQGQPVQSYIDKPIDFEKTKEQIEQEEREKQEQEIKNALSRMKSALNNN